MMRAVENRGVERRRLRRGGSIVDEGRVGATRAVIVFGGGM